MQDDIRDIGSRQEKREVLVTEPRIAPDHQLPPPGAPPERRRSTLVRVLVWLIVLAAFALLFWSIWHHKQTPASGSGGGRRGAFAGAVPVSVSTAHKGDIGVYLESIGTVTPVYTATLNSQVTGVISAVRYREGQLVRRGEPLIEIDPRPYQAQVLTASGALERDTNLLAQAEMDLKRYQAAWARNAIQKQTLDDQEKLVEQYKGTVKADQGTLQYDQVQLGFCNIIAPINGRIGLRLVDPGNLATASSTTPLAVITQLQPITVVFTIPEDSLGQLEQQLRKGRTLQVFAYDRAGLGKLGAGKLETTDNQIDTTTGTLKLRAVFPNQNNALFPNLFVNTRLLLNTLQNVVLIPSSSIQHNGDVAYVFLIQNGVAHIHNIKPGVSEGDTTEVQGLNPGDVVADSSFEKLQDGSKVNISKQSLLPANNESNAP